MLQRSAKQLIDRGLVDARERMSEPTQPTGSWLEPNLLVAPAALGHMALSTLCFEDFGALGNDAFWCFSERSHF